MLFPRKDEYISWFRNAGFEDIKVEIESPKWYRGTLRHGVIMGCWVTGVKKASGDSPLKVLIYCSVVLSPLSLLSSSHFVIFRPKSFLYKIAR